MNATTQNPTVVHLHWLPRISLALVFIYHGFQKLSGWGSFSQAPEMMQGMFFNSSAFFGLVGLGELAAGIGVIVGAFTHGLVTRVSGLVIALIMLGAIFTVHLPFGFNFMAEGPGGYAFQLTLFLSALFLIGYGRSGENFPG